MTEQLKNMNTEGVIEKLQDIKKLVDLKKTDDFNICIQIARDYFEEFFNHLILNLVYSFPKDYINTHGILFWSGSKRFPDAVTFDPSD